jgi:hypothetical protein
MPPSRVDMAAVVVATSTTPVVPTSTTPAVVVVVDVDVGTRVDMVAVVEAVVAAASSRAPGGTLLQKV